jgi:hypothetical protein
LVENSNKPVAPLVGVTLYGHPRATRVVDSLLALLIARKNLAAYRAMYSAIKSALN